MAMAERAYNALRFIPVLDYAGTDGFVTATITRSASVAMYGWALFLSGYIYIFICRIRCCA